MTYYVTALSNDKAQLIEKTLCTSCSVTAEMIAETWEYMGFKIVRREEE